MVALLVLWLYLAGMIGVLPLVGEAYGGNLRAARRPSRLLAAVAVIGWPLVIPAAFLYGVVRS